MKHSLLSKWREHRANNKSRRDADAGICSALVGAVASDVGLLRENNEDNYLLGRKWNANFADRRAESYAVALPVRKWQCMAVFDGMGGGENGELASACAAETFRLTMTELAATESPEVVRALARKAFFEANRRIVAGDGKHPILGTTATVLLTDGERFQFFHIGDSRGYLLRKNRLIRITQDQTLAALKIQGGFYTADHPDARKDQHKLTQFLGCDPQSDKLEPEESGWITLDPGDVFLLCSDGLYDMCAEQHIQTILSQPKSPVELSAELVQAALQAGGRDNVTCLVAKIRPAQSAQKAQAPNPMTPPKAPSAE